MEKGVFLGLGRPPRRCPPPAGQQSALGRSSARKVGKYERPQRQPPSARTKCPTMGQAARLPPGGTGALNASLRLSYSEKPPLRLGRGCRMHWPEHGLSSPHRRQPCRLGPLHTIPLPESALRPCDPQPTPRSHQRLCLGRARRLLACREGQAEGRSSSPQRLAPQPPSCVGREP